MPKKKEEKTLKWRLSSLPTPKEVRNLVKDGIITQKEARNILFSEETKKERDKKSLESEIKFLRELVDKLSHNRVDTVIKYIENTTPNYSRWEWVKPYEFLCSTWTTTTGGNIDTSGTIYMDSSGDTGLYIEGSDSINLSSLN